MPSSQPSVLKSKDIKGVAEYMKSERCKRVFVMAGAGISTSAGIPDFRSPETGLYHNLQRLNLPYAEAVFDIDYFKENPIPFYTLAKDMDPSKFRPTPAHSFFHLLDQKGLLRTCFTQNIDTLERRAGLREEKIVEAHGSFASNSCVECKMPYGEEGMKRAVEAGEPARCESCGGLVKPDIVFFGEGLPASFFATVPQLRNADLLFILGTSLTVMPFAGICRLVPESCPRVLINLDQVGDIGSRREDVLALGKCDDVVRELCAELGWAEELEALWQGTKGMGSGEKVEEEEEVERIARDIEEKLKIEEKVEEVVEERLEEEGQAKGVSKPVQPEGEEDKGGKEKEGKTEGISDPTKPELTAKYEVNSKEEVGAGVSAAVGAEKDKEGDSTSKEKEADKEGKDAGKSAL